MPSHAGEGYRTTHPTYPAFEIPSQPVPPLTPLPEPLSMSSIRMFTGQITDVHDVPGTSGDPGMLSAKLTLPGSRRMGVHALLRSVPDLVDLFQDFAPGIARATGSRPIETVQP